VAETKAFIHDVIASAKVFIGSFAQSTVENSATGPVGPFQVVSVFLFGIILKYRPLPEELEQRMKKMSDSFQIVVGAGPDGQPVSQAMRLANRHGLVAGATGTGKTVTLQHLAELFSDAGVAVFAADVKGDLCGLGAAGAPQGKVAERIAGMPWLNHRPQAYPVTLWDIAGQSGHPLRTTLSEMGPAAGQPAGTDRQPAGGAVCGVQGGRPRRLLLLDLKDLKALLAHLKDNPQLLGEDSALMTSASTQALLRRLATLEQQGAEALFGEPALQLEDLLQPGSDGRGRIHLLDASRLVHEAPKVYATFLLWLLAELFEQLPERGDADKPVLALFFDEAHLLFNGTPKALQDRLEQVVRLIRSKGVGVYFVTQSPGDLPDDVLAQLGLRIQHGLRAFTAKEQKSLRAVADGFRPNPAFDSLTVLTELGIGEALVGTLEEKGTPGHGPAGAGAPPQSRIGPLSAAERSALIAARLCWAVTTNRSTASRPMKC
jgi:DNA helicase HerA-like ATPase